MTDYKDLINALREADEIALTGLRNPFRFSAYYNVAADAIEELSRENESLGKSLCESVELVRKLSKPKWIPVTERLPGAGEIVLVYGKRGGIYTAEHNRNGRWPGSFWKLNSKSHHCEPTHWIPLPEPPKEGSE